MHSYHNRDFIGNINLNELREKVTLAQNGNLDFIENIEKTYLWYIGGAELAYFWAAHGLLGYNYHQAAENVCTMMIPNINFRDFKSMQVLFGNNINMEYKPLNPIDRPFIRNNQSSWKIQAAQNHLQKVINFLENQFPLQIKFHDTIKIRSCDEVNRDIKNGVLKNEDQFEYCLYKKGDEYYISYDLISIPLSTINPINQEVFLCWIAIARDDADFLLSPHNSPIIEIWEFTQYLQNTLQGFIVDIGAVKEGNTYYRKFAWALVL